MEKPILKIEKQILDKFWLLAESDETGIIKATDSLLGILRSKQKLVDGDKKCNELQYTINRLVKGLASSRQSARQGFSVALCQVLRTIKNISVDDVLRAVAEHLKFTQKESKSEQGNILLGKALAYLALIQSGRLCEATGSHVKKVTNRLLEIRKKKSYLQQICTHAIALITAQVDQDVFTSSVWPEIESEMTGGWTVCTPETLLVLLACCRHQPKTVTKKFLKTHWAGTSVVCEKNVEHLWTILLQTASCYPSVHLLNDRLMEEVVMAGIPIDQFWSHGASVLFGKNQMRLMNIGMYLLQRLIPHVTSAEQMKGLLSPAVITSLIRVVDGRSKDSNPLYSVAKETVTKLLQFTKTTTNHEIQIAVLKCLKNTECHLGPEIIKSMDAIVQNLTQDGVKLYGEYLMKTFNKLVSKSEDEEDTKLQNIVTELRTLVTQPKIASDHDFQLHLLQFLALHSFWTVTEKSTDISHCSKVLESMDKSLRKQFQDNFFKALHNLLIFKTERSKSSSLGAFIHTVHQLAKYIQVLLTNQNKVSMVTHFTEQVTEEWNKVVTKVESLLQKQDTNSSDKLEVSAALQLLLLHNALQLFVDSKNAVSVLQDVHLCCENAMKTKKRVCCEKSKKRSAVTCCDPEPEWIEVVTELLLSMMSQGSSLARAVAKNVFSHLTTHITPDSLSLITDILRAQKDDKEAPISFKDEDDEDEEMEDMDKDDKTDKDENGMENNDDIDEEENSEESDSTDESESDEEEENEVNDELRQKVKSALGNAADDFDKEDDEEDSDLSDSEMFKFDKALVAAFRGVQAGKEKVKRENRKQLVAFKLRVLDLIEILVKSQPPADLTLDLIFPLLEVMFQCTNQKEEPELGNRTTNIFRLLYKKAKIHGNVAVSTDMYIEVLKILVELSTKASTRELTVDISDACLLVIRLLFNLEIGSQGPSPVKTRSQKALQNKASKAEKEEERIHTEVLSIIKSSLSDSLLNKDHKLNQAFFHNMFTKFPVLFWPVTDVILAAIVDTNCKVYDKTQGCSMLVVMVNKDTEENIGEDAWNSFSTTIKEVINKVLVTMDKTDYKSKLVHELFQVLHKIVHLSKTPQSLPDEVLGLMENMKECYNKDTRKLYNGIRGKLRERTVAGDLEMKNGKKRKQSQRETVKAKKKK